MSKKAGKAGRALKTQVAVSRLGLEYGLPFSPIDIIGLSLRSLPIELIILLTISHTLLLTISHTSGERLCPAVYPLSLRNLSFLDPHLPPLPRNPTSSKIQL